MPTEFVYKARDLEGAEITGMLRLDSPEIVREHLGRKNLIPIWVREYSEQRSFSWRRLLKRRVKIPELILFTRKLNALYRSGIPLTRALTVIGDHGGDHRISDVADRIRTDLEQGFSFSEAVAHYPDVFSDVYINSIRAAETSGRLDVVLDKLGDALEREMETREQIKTAVRYPILVVVVVVIAFFALVTFVVPKFSAFFSKYHAVLPLPTRMLIALNQLISQYWYLFAFLLAVAIPVAVKLFKVKQVRERFDRILLRLPVFGQLLNKIYISRFSHLLGITYGSGAPLLSGLEVVKRAVGNRVIEGEVEIIRNQIQKGSDLAGIRHLLPHFPSLALSMMQVGLESGSLEFMLNQVSSFYDREVDYTSKRLMTLIEPFLIIFLGAVVLFLALSIFLPMWSILEVFKPR